MWKNLVLYFVSAYSKNMHIVLAIFLSGETLFLLIPLLVFSLTKIAGFQHKAMSHWILYIYHCYSWRPEWAVKVDTASTYNRMVIPSPRGADTIMDSPYHTAGAIFICLWLLTLTLTLPYPESEFLKTFSLYGWFLTHNSHSIRVYLDECMKKHELFVNITSRKI